MGHFSVGARVRGLLAYSNNFCLSFALFLLYHVVLSLCGVGGIPAINSSQPNYSCGCFVVGL